MRTVSVSQLKARLSEELEHVQSGEEVVVTDRGRPIARLVPLEAATTDLAPLVRSGLVRLGAGLADDFWSLPRPADPSGALRAAAVAEREEGW